MIRNSLLILKHMYAILNIVHTLNQRIMFVLLFFQLIYSVQGLALTLIIAK